MGVLRVKANGVWEDITGVTTNEVAVAATDPRAGTMANTELWIDTSTDPPLVKFWSTQLNPAGWATLTQDYLTQAEGDVRYDRKAAQQKDGFAITAGTWYRISGPFGSNSIFGRRWAFAAECSTGGQIVHGLATASTTVKAGGGGSITVDGNTFLGTKLFNRVNVMWDTGGQGYKICARAAVAATINVGWEAYSLADANNPAGGDFMPQGASTEMAFVDL